ncbi:hypothetical protein H4R19_004895, partial [Coemansia spiralis]
MRVGDSSSGSTAGGAAARLAERYRLSFGGHAVPGHTGPRRRVFAQLAPHSAEVAAAAGDSGSDEAEVMFDGNADQYFDSQMMMLLPPTPPRQRPIDAESLNSESGSDDDDDDSGERQAAADTAGLGYDGWQAQQALAHLAQQRRHQFLHSQRQRHGAATS